MKRLMAVVILSVLAGSVAAGDNREMHAVSFDPQVFQEQRRALERELRVGDTYSEIAANDRQKVVAALDRMAQALAQVNSLDELDETERMHIYNLQSEVNGILTGAAEDSREVCTRHKPVGTNFPQTTCKTVAEWRRIRENNQNYFRSRKTAGLPREDAIVTRTIQ